MAAMKISGLQFSGSQMTQNGFVTHQLRNAALVGLAVDLATDNVNTF